ncbi:hypothetical protein SAZ10_22970 [Mesorhizobium sp. BAC0120]|uniref:hypothetical protein n=1 Tax=Mesorhizobium sp. BAC0120 TaxID=3090670 RepID=UPI00298D514C|nr:hypothetical protein [Mesorhizobium sp. BAC0120]MDW6024621.1 hypothetical protein [Mesorhizobium sp. BAC0120]
MAIYAAKAAGRNTFRIFDEAMHEASQISEHAGSENRVTKLPVLRDRVSTWFA